MCYLRRYMLFSRIIHGETVRNVEITYQEHEDAQKDSEPALRLKNSPTHLFTWKFFLLLS